MSISSSTAGAARSNGQAIVVMCTGVVCLVMSDTLAKWLTDHYTPLQIVFVRNLMAMPIIAAIALWIGGPSALGTRHIRVHALRGLLLVLAAVSFFTALSFLPLAEATSLIFAAPVFITALSVPLLGEQVGWRRWAAVIVGFAGVLVIVRPGAAAFQAASIFAVAAAALYALLMISARWIGREENFWTMMFYVVVFPMLFSGLVVPFVWRPVDPAHLPLLFGVAVMGTLGVTLLGQAFRLGTAAVVAPFDYTALIWASLFGWVVWGEIPSVWTYAGAAVIIASGIYIVLRETRTDTKV